MPNAIARALALYRIAATLLKMLRIAAFGRLANYSVD